MIIIKIEFSSQEIIDKRDVIDLGICGEIHCRFITIDDPEHAPHQIKIHGDLVTFPKHVDEPIVVRNTIIDVEIEPFYLDKSNPNERIYPPAERLSQISASEICNAPWVEWMCRNTVNIKY